VLARAGARPQRVLWASTSTKDPAFPDTYYLGILAAPDTIDTMPEKTLLAFADHGGPVELMQARLRRGAKMHCPNRLSRPRRGRVRRVVATPRGSSVRGRLAALLAISAKIIQLSADPQAGRPAQAKEPTP
jgi:hypothetical protein